MAGLARANEAADMDVSVAPAPASRRADNDLFDAGCDLVEAAAAIRRGAGRPEALRAAPAVLGCIESALQELRHATSELERASARSIEHAGHPRRHQRIGAMLERMHRGAANLQQALADAEDAAAAARSLAGRALVAAGVIRTPTSRWRS